MPLNNKQPRLLTKEVGFGEGPLWHPDGFLLFSDQVENCIKKLTPEGEVSIYIEKSGCDVPAPHSREDSTGSNALAWVDGKLIMCRHGSRSIAFWEEGKFTTLVDSYKGKPLNSPNDFIISKNGVIYFTDPPYGLEGQQLWPEHRQPLAGVYKLEGEELTLLWDGWNYPNGVELSPDEKTLYVSSADEGDDGIYQADLVDGIPQNFRPFANVKADGILIDKAGNLYTASGDFVYQFNPAGEKIGECKIGVSTSNLAWGGAGGRDLYITCYDSVWLIADVND
jgi:sugar lactone lactonase YvrE